jgi:hypothetical protein
MDKPEKLIGELTPEEITKLKKLHGTIFKIEVDGHVCYLKKPDRKTLSYASVAAKTDPLKFNEVILNGCFVGGSPEIKTNDDLFLSVGQVLPDLIEVETAELVKL